MDETREEAAARYRTDKPKMKKCAKLSYYLAGIADGAFHLPVSEEALQRVRSQKGRVWKDYAEVEDYAELFELAELDAEMDADGNVVGLTWDADYQPWPLLAVLAPWVQEGSFFLMVDDGGSFHEAVFKGGRLEFAKQAVPRDWLQRIRGEAKQITDTLQAAGWTLDAERMAYAKKQVEYWGAAAKAEIDAECPETVLAYDKGAFDLLLKYRGHDKGSWIKLEIESRTPWDQLYVEYPGKVDRDGMLAAIVAAQDTLDEESWVPWVRAHVASFRPKLQCPNRTGYFAQGLAE